MIMFTVTLHYMIYLCLCLPLHYLTSYTLVVFTATLQHIICIDFIYRYITTHYIFYCIYCYVVTHYIHWLYLLLHYNTLDTLVVFAATLQHVIYIGCI